MAFNITMFKPGTQDRLIAEEFVTHGRTREEVIRQLFPRVGKREPFVYRENIGAGRRRKPLRDQYHLFLYNINRTMGKMRKAGWEYTESYSDRIKWSSKERHWVNWRKKYIQDLIDEGLIDNPEEIKPNTPIPAPGEVKPVTVEGEPIGGNGVDLTPQQLNELFEKLKAEGKIDEFSDNEWGEYERREDEEADHEEEEVAIWTLDDDGNYIREPKLSKSEAEKIVKEVDELEKKIREKPKTRADKIDEFYKKMYVARDFVVSREIGGEYVDFISTRAIKDGAKAIAYGISVEEIFRAVTKTWSEDTKRELERHERPWKPSEPTIDVDRYPALLDGAHQYLGYVVILAKARIPIFLVGPSGSGKSFMARDLAMYLEMEYGEIPLTAGATPSWLVGAETISGYKSRPFVEIYGEGGCFCFEEMDAADPNMLLIVNNALANESFFNPVTGEEIEKHKNFIAVATANTWGVGANRLYTGRERLDAATLDRWRAGRVEVDYDYNIEKMIIADMKRLADKLEHPKPKPKKVKKVKA